MTPAGQPRSPVEAPRPLQTANGSLPDRLTEAARPPSAPSSREAELSNQLRGLAERLAERRFQLAVVGQFKRGKSSLLNALIGKSVLPTGVLPLTALPTFLHAGDTYRLDVTRLDGGVDRFELASAAQAQAKAAAFVAESGNPENVERVARVDIALPSSLLATGLVLVDTPGVGSAAAHNTHVAEAALAEADAALLVLSPDPPITEVELDYLAKVRRNAAQVLVACNKADLATPDEIAEVAAYTRRELARAGLPDAELFQVSARRALGSGVDVDGPDDSGVAALRTRLASLATREGGRLLDEAAAIKAAAIVRELAFENDLTAAALAAPANVLARQIEAFDAARAVFDRDRQAAGDQIEGDRRRLLEGLDQGAEREARALAADLTDRVAKADHGQGPRGAWDALRIALPKMLQARETRLVETQRAALEAALGRRQARADDLLESLRRTAATLMRIDYAAPASKAALRLDARGYWVDRPRETLAAAPAQVVERLLPGPIGRAVARRRVRAEIDQVVTANIEHMRWALRRNLEDALRRYAAELDRTLAAGAAAIGDGLVAARALRDRDLALTSAAVAERDERRARLASLQRALEPLSRSRGDAAARAADLRRGEGARERA